jgi:aerobic carbon-monoxide dehydrogenase small subunit
VNVSEPAGGEQSRVRASASEPAGGEQIDVPMGGELDVTLRVNGVARQLRVPPRRLLSDALRHDLRLTGTHVGCEHGVCGCCTVLLDGRPVRSCLMFAVGARGHEITTVEGLTPDGDGLHPIQRAFQECHGLQCGFCTPGFLMSVAGLLAETPQPSRDEIVEGISGNLCRCTGYQNIIAAVERAAELSAQASGVVPRADAGESPPPPDAPPTPYGAAGGDVPGTARADADAGREVGP